MSTRVGGTLKKIMLLRVIANDGDYERSVFTEEDITAAAAEHIERRQCLDWQRHFYEKYTDGDDRKLQLALNELSEDEVCCQTFKQNNHTVR
jgi:hypothetical protein